MMWSVKSNTFRSQKKEPVRKCVGWFSNCMLMAGNRTAVLFFIIKPDFTQLL